MALAANACAVWAALGDERPATPEEVLGRYSLSEIAALCEELVQTKEVAK